MAKCNRIDIDMKDCHYLQCRKGKCAFQSPPKLHAPANPKGPSLSKRSPPKAKKGKK